jgi:hypothetical protein
MLLPLYLQGKNRYPLDRRLSGPESQSGRGGEEKNPCPAISQTPVVQLIALSLY